MQLRIIYKTAVDYSMKMIYNIMILFEYIRGKGGIAMQTENPLHIAVCDDRSDDLAEIISMTSQILQEENIYPALIPMTGLRITCIRK